MGVCAESVFANRRARLVAGRVLLVILAVAKGGQTEGSDGDRPVAKYAWVRGTGVFGGQ